VPEVLPAHTAALNRQTRTWAQIPGLPDLARACSCCGEFTNVSSLDVDARLPSVRSPHLAVSPEKDQRCNACAGERHYRWQGCLREHRGRRSAGVDGLACRDIGHRGAGRSRTNRSERRLRKDDRHTKHHYQDEGHAPNGSPHRAPGDNEKRNADNDEYGAEHSQSEHWESRQWQPVGP